jgi:hypothetical protein
MKSEKCGIPEYHRKNKIPHLEESEKTLFKCLQIKTYKDMDGKEG